MIQVKNLTKTFKNHKAVDSITFSVAKGEIVGLLGENGAGKTTTLRMLATILKPTAGTASINGYDVITQGKEVRGEIGILFGGEVGLYDRLTARENIKYFANLNGMDSKDANNNIEYLAQMLDMTKYLEKRVGKFSRGMKQKVAIARSIVHNPSVMLFDEPTMGLDVSSSRVVQDFILKCKRDGKAIILSSHTMSEVKKLCDRVVVIHKGIIIEEGTCESFMEKYKSRDMEEIFMNMVGDQIEK